METVDLSRREALRYLGLGLGLGAVSLLTGCGGTSKPETPLPELQVAGYLPTYYEDAVWSETARPEIVGQVDRLHVAFGIPDENGEAIVPEMTPDYIAMLGNLSANTEIMMSLGGWTADGSAQGREKMQQRLNSIFDDPERFAESAVVARDVFAARIKRDPAKVGIDFDLEHPDADQADAMTTIVAYVRDSLPDTSLTMAVPPGSSQAGYEIERLGQYLTAINGMFYDYAIPNTESDSKNRSGYIAPQDQVMSDIDAMIYRLGDASKLMVGFPAYGYRFPAVNGPNEHYESTGSEEELTVSFKDIPLNQVNDMGGIQLNGAWTTLVTPNMIRATQAQIRQKHHNLGGSFVWELTGATPDFMNALHARQAA